MNDQTRIEKPEPKPEHVDTSGPYEMAEITLDYIELSIVLRQLSKIHLVDMKMDEILPLKNVINQMKFAHETMNKF